MGTKTTPCFGARGCCWLLRGLIAEKGFRVPVGTFLFVNLRQLNYQTLENATGVGAPPWKWPTVEQVIDLLRKAIYAFVTGAQPPIGSLRRTDPRGEAATR